MCVLIVVVVVIVVIFMVNISTQLISTYYTILSMLHVVFVRSCFGLVFSFMNFPLVCPFSPVEGSRAYLGIEKHIPQPFSYLWLVGNGGMGYNYNYYYYHSSIPY